MKKLKPYILISVFFLYCGYGSAQENTLKILNFNGDNGFQHASKEAGLEMIEGLGVANNWEVVTSKDTADIKLKKLESFDVIVFNNNCGNKGRIFSDTQQSALQNYIRSGGGFVAIHCAGAIWKEEGQFQQWYEKLVGARMVKHPEVQEAKLVVEDKNHIATAHLPNEWVITDEWHTFSHNPRKEVNVLLSLDESSYEGTPKMGGDHPFTWYQYYDGGRSFFTSLGHTTEMHTNEKYQKLVEGGILWASGKMKEKLPTSEGLLLDLNADYGVTIEKGNSVSSWKNSVENTSIVSFDKQDIGRKVKGSGMPRLAVKVPELNGHNTVVFHRQELVNENEDAFDHLITGNGYTWFAIMSVYDQQKGKPGVNSFFGNLRNTNVDKQGNYEGFWGGLDDTNRIWMGSRNALERGLWNINSPQVLQDEKLKTTTYYLVMGRMGAGVEKVQMELFNNGMPPLAKGEFIVNTKANSSKMVIGQERDATNHPGAESFDGEIARFLIFERPLTDDQLKKTANHLKAYYGLK